MAKPKDLNKVGWNHPVKRIFFFKRDDDNDGDFLIAIGLKPQVKAYYYNTPENMSLETMNVAAAGIEDYIGRRLTVEEVAWLFTGDAPPPKLRRIDSNFVPGAASDKRS